MMDFTYPYLTVSPLDITESIPPSGNISSPDKSLDLSRMKEAAYEFESLFISQMLHPMFKGIYDNNPDVGNSESIWRQMQVDEFGKAIAANGGIGIADMVLNEMIKLQEI